jgi:transcription-repair coupling factor (superfamily II helicase)
MLILSGLFKQGCKCEMNLSYLNKIIGGNENIQRLTAALSQGKSLRNHILVLDAAKPFFISALREKSTNPICLLANNSEKAQKLYLELLNWLPDASGIFLYPEKGSGPARDDPETSAERLKALAALKNYDPGRNAGPVIISSTVSAATGIISPEVFTRLNQSLARDMKADPDSVIRKCVDSGYEMDEIVELPGYISRRGGIVDIFPINSEMPVRVEFDGKRIESIRQFDPRTQRSTGLVESVEIAAREDGTSSAQSTVFDYLPQNTLLLIDDYEELEPSYAELSEAARTPPAEEENAEGPGKMDIYLLEWEGLKKKLDGFKHVIELALWNSAVEPGETIFQFSSLPKFGGRLADFISELKSRLGQRQSILIVSQQEQRLFEMLQENLVHVHHVPRLESEIAPGTVVLLKGSLNEGWALKDNFLMYTDNEIFGWVKQERSFKKRPTRHHLLLNQLNRDDYVVHIDHGIGRFTGFSRVRNNEVETEYAVIEYAAGDKLYVPVDQVDRLTRYVGSGDRAPSLSRLHTQEWSQTKARIKKSVEDIAQDLLNLYATRETVSGYAFSPDTIWQKEMESSFPYVETADQLRAVNDVKTDMEIDKPMDRLICGDVGYGKTEIALRAAFKAVQDSKQVALLVPTTVLAQQHYATFRNRLLAFPLRLEVLSRFTAGKDEKAILEGLASGAVDICIGTHRLLQKDVLFKDLGLLIVDEEQRFGVAHKEFIKRLRQEIDVLALSATPIPRTLHMSLAGIKDLSTLETPPEDRLPIKTHVGIYDKAIIRDAILREIHRGGQIFYVHNRIHDIHRLEYDLKQLVPQARIMVGHGQMMEDDLEVIMAEFVNCRADILLTTTIIESGIDIPNANTMIIDDADRLGLTQLYQLRGRIGRGTNNAFAYFFYRPNKHLTEQAIKRLKTIAEATELGAGFAIAMKDLEIRGAGNLLGTEQSGYISSVGFDLYCRLLAEAVEDIRSRKGKGSTPGAEAKPKLPAVSISLPLAALIPADYMSGENDRIRYYQKIASIRDKTDLASLVEELTDRFGDPVEEMANLLFVARVKLFAAECGVESISGSGGQVTLRFWKDISREAKVHVFASRYDEAIDIGNKLVKIDTEIKEMDWKKILLELVQYLGPGRSGKEPAASRLQ